MVCNVERQPEINVRFTQEEAEALIEMFLMNSTTLDKATESMLAQKIRVLSEALDKTIKGEQETLGVA